MNHLYTKLSEIEKSTQKACLCTIISTKGSTPRKTGTKMIVFENKVIDGTIGGGALEQKVIQQAIKVIENQKGTIVSHQLVKDLDMCCGGTVEVFMEPIKNKKKLLIFGAGHVGKMLAKFAIDLDFIVHLIDNRMEILEEIDFPDLEKHALHYADFIAQFPFDTNTMVAIVTHDHASDREILALTANKKTAYVGMIGSERKVLVAKETLINANLVDKEKLEKVNMPIGIPILAISPEEIAVSILAKLIEVRNS